MIKLFIWIPDQVGNDKPVTIDPSRRSSLSFLFVIVGLDPTIQKISDSLSILLVVLFPR
jgi:hypothetical protein